MSGSEIFLEKVSGAAIPIDEDSAMIFNSFPLGQKFEVVEWSERNLGFHKKIFSLLNIVLQNNPKWKGYNPRKFLADIQLDIGWSEDHKDYKDRLQRRPVSISFKKMSEIKFTKLFNEVNQFLLTNLEELLPNMPEAVYESYVHRILDCS